ncbi:type III secretion system protein PrgD, partial [Enterococcus faecalis]
AALKISTDRILFSYVFYYIVSDENGIVRETMTLPVVEETVLLNMVQTVETNEEVRQEDLDAFLHLFKRNVSNKPKRV